MPASSSAASSNRINAASTIGLTGDSLATLLAIVGVAVVLVVLVMGRKN